MTQKERFRLALRLFEEKMPEPQTELSYNNPFELLIAVILSAQCTDKRVNQVTPPLFAAYPDAATLAEASEEELKTYISSVTYPNAKTRNILKAARMLRDEFNGAVPSDIDSLMRLPGVGRKTANVMLAVACDEAAMPVDTHVFRVSNRIGLTVNSRTPLETERKLVANIPAEKLSKAHHWLILHGRYICKARKPECSECFLTEICRFHNSSQKKSPSSGRNARKGTGSPDSASNNPSPSSK